MDNHLVHEGGDSLTVKPRDRQTHVLIIFLEPLNEILPQYFNKLNLQILAFVRKSLYKTGLCHLQHRV